MKKRLAATLLFFISFITLPSFAQTPIEPVARDTMQQHEPAEVFMVGDTLTPSERNQLEKNLNLQLVESFSPDPSKAVIYAAIFPGLGQIYNRKYWKLPIVYGGFLGIAYAITWNGNMYTDYQNAYKDIMIDPYNRTRWHDFVYDPSVVLNSSTELTRTQSFLKRRRDYFRRNRDLAIIVGLGLHALCMIDAYVDAHLYNFDVSPDLSMTMMPVVWGPSEFSGGLSVGIQCNIVF